MLRISILFMTCLMSLRAEQQVLLVLLKGANALGYYTLEGQLQTAVSVGRHPHEMVLSPDGKYVYITDNGTMRIEHAGKGGNTVSVVDIAARKRADTMSTGSHRRPHGISIDPRTWLLAVTTEAPDRLVLFDGRQRRYLRHFEVRGKTTHMVSLGPGKSGAEWAYVSNSGMDTVTAVQLTTGANKVIQAGDRPEGSVLSKDGKHLFVANREAATVTIIDTERHAAIGEIRTGKGPVRIGITPDGKTLVYALMHDRKIEFTDLDTRRPVAQVAVDGDPISISVSADGKFAFAAAEEKDTVYVISVPERKLVRQFQTAKGAGPDALLLVTLP